MNDEHEARKQQHEHERRITNRSYKYRVPRAQAAQEIAELDRKRQEKQARRK